MKLIPLAGISLLLLSACVSTPPADTNAVSSASSVAEWQTYRNDDSGYQISHPVGWELNENANGGENAFKGVTLKQGHKWGVAILDLGEMDDAAFSEEPLLMFQDYSYDPIMTVTADGRAEKLYVLSNRDDMQMGYPVEVVSRKGKDTILLDGFYFDNADKDEFVSIFKKVVETFERTK